MSKAFEFLKECGVFFLLTEKDDSPMGRPFGAIAEWNGKLWIATGNQKDVYAQMKENPHIQLLAIKAGTRKWLRLSAIAEETGELTQKARLLKECPILNKHYLSAECDFYAVFALTATDCQIFG